MVTQISYGNDLAYEEQMRSQQEALNSQRQYDYSTSQGAGGSSSLFDSGEFYANQAGTNEQASDTIFRFVRDQLNASRARFNRIGRTTGATEQQMQDAQNPLLAQLGAIDSNFNKLSGLTNELTSSSLGTSAGAGVAAANAARLSGNGRMGGGGNAARVAARGATDAAVGQSAALSQALVQGRLGEAQYQSNLLQQRGGINAALSQLLQSQAGLREDRARLGVANENEAAQALVGSLDVYGDLESAKLGFSDDVEIAWLGVLGNVGASYARSR